MSKPLTSIQFCKKLKDSVREYKKQLNDTRSESDAAHFFNPELKKFLLNHHDDLNILANLNFEKPFMSWVNGYIERNR